MILALSKAQEERTPGEVVALVLPGQPGLHGSIWDWFLIFKAVFMPA